MTFGALGWTSSSGRTRTRSHRARSRALTRARSPLDRHLNRSNALRQRSYSMSLHTAHARTGHDARAMRNACAHACAHMSDATTRALHCCAEHRSSVVECVITGSSSSDIDLTSGFSALDHVGSHSSCAVALPHECVVPLYERRHPCIVCTHVRLAALTAMDLPSTVTGLHSSCRCISGCSCSERLTPGGWFYRVMSSWLRCTMSHGLHPPADRVRS